MKTDGLHVCSTGNGYSKEIGRHVNSVGQRGAVFGAQQVTAIDECMLSKLGMHASTQRDACVA